MSLSPRQWAQLGVTLAVAGAAILGGVLLQSPTAPKVLPTASRAAAPAILASTAGVSSLTPPATAADSGATLAWPGIIAVDAPTGALRSDLGWRPGGESEGSLSIIRCAVATEIKPRYRRVLTAPNTPIVKPAWVWSDCQRGFHTWDSLEAVSQGRWPKP